MLSSSPRHLMVCAIRANHRRQFRLAVVQCCYRVVTDQVGRSYCYCNFRPCLTILDKFHLLRTRTCSSLFWSFHYVRLLLMQYSCTNSTSNYYFQRHNVDDGLPVKAVMSRTPVYYIKSRFMTISISLSQRCILYLKAREHIHSILECARPYGVPDLT